MTLRFTVNSPVAFDAWPLVLTINSYQLLQQLHTQIFTAKVSEDSCSRAVGTLSTSVGHRCGSGVRSCQIHVDPPDLAHAQFYGV